MAYNIWKDMALIEIRRNGCTRHELKALKKGLDELELRYQDTKWEPCSSLIEIDKEAYRELVDKRKSILLEFQVNTSGLVEYTYEELEVLFE